MYTGILNKVFRLKKLTAVGVNVINDLKKAAQNVSCEKLPSNCFVRVLHTNRLPVDISIDDPELKTYTNKLISEYNALTGGDVIDTKRIGELKPIMDILNNIKDLEENLHIVKEMKSGAADDKEMFVMAEREEQTYKEKLIALNLELLELLIPTQPEDNCSGVVLEVMPGVGGQEAMLFARELFDMYSAFTAFQNWDADVAVLDKTETGGVRHGSLLVKGAGSYSLLCHEAGVHRVQRVPVTERSGRIHTSTVAVTVLPQPSEVEVVLKESDLEIETKRSSGAGGQHVNTTDSAVRIVHRPTGISVESQVDRSQHRNKAIAMERLRARIWKIQTEQEESRISTERKLQIGTSMRSEKIRTYNFQRDTVVDHRIAVTIHNLREFFEGGLLLDQLMRRLQQHHNKERLLAAIRA